MLRQDHYKTSVYKTPFHERTSELNILNEWSRWKDYTVPTNYFRTDLEYFSVRNTTGVIDYTPMIKQKITGPDAAEFVNRFFTKCLEGDKRRRIFFAPAEPPKTCTEA